ncbi:DUF3327 domain-containing protein [Pseudoalteromonas sp. MMG010]|uniref:alpha/beta hydrolase-fold protein n=1 Tax=Pseudoalteromonas sp. MMG010 TaxID=2822685 RepID=UPI001B3A4A17|nr:alpha/beta hydrolase-fold protein [Pseudoalteromonas sp. MMG010]MBQ4833159.1 DUF3327 domain-containing protein [Pseudoalteromonas sp. MMG010]
MRFSIVIMCIFTFGLVQPAYGQNNLQPTAKLTAQEYVFKASKGSYISADVVTNNHTVVNLIDQQGKLIREVINTGESHARLHFIAAYDNPKLQFLGAKPEIKTHRIVSTIEQNSYHKKAQSELINQAYAQLKSGETEDNVWDKLIRNNSPLIEPLGDESVLTFIYRGAKKNVLIFGAPANDHGWMERLGHSNIWFKSYTVPNSTRLSYKLAPDVPLFAGSRYEQRVALLATVQRDPTNPNYFPVSDKTKYNQSSTVELPDADAQYPKEMTVSTLNPDLSFQLTSTLLKNKRNIKVFRFGDVTQANAVQLFMFDGLKYLDKVNLHLRLSTLVSQQRLPPIEAVFIDNLDSKTRAKELPSNPLFTQMLATELLPIIEQNSPVKFTAQQRVIAGSSFGGIGATTTAFRRPDIFGHVISLSGSYWWTDKHGDNSHYYASEKFIQATKKPIEFFISAGVFESSRDGNKGILDGSRHLRDILTMKGYKVSYKEYAAGHDYFAWQGAIIDGLQALFPQE